MLYWALAFFLIALVAAFFGFGGVAAGAAGIAKVLFFIFVVLFVGSIALHLFDQGADMAQMVFPLIVTVSGGINEIV